MSRQAKVSVDQILINLDRTNGGMGNIETLAESIRTHGLINAPTVRDVSEDGTPDGDRVYQIIAGRRRMDAIKLLGWTEVFVNIYEKDELVDDESIALAENVVRLDMHPLDEAKLYTALMQQGSSVEELSKLYDRSKSHVYQRCALLNLIDDMADLFRAGRLSIMQAAMIADLPKEEQTNIHKDIARGDDVVDSWRLNRAIDVHSGCKLDGYLFTCEICENCEKRTHYSDESLFPELQQQMDYCKDRECFNEKLRISLSAVVSKIMEEKKSSFRKERKKNEIIIMATQYAEHIQSIEINGEEIPVAKNTGYWIVPNVSKLSNEEKKKVHYGIFLQHGVQNVSVSKFLFSRDVAQHESGNDSAEYLEDTAGMSDKEKKAYREVMNDQWDIERLCAGSVFTNLSFQVTKDCIKNDTLFMMLCDRCPREYFKSICKKIIPELTDDNLTGESFITDIDLEKREQILFAIQIRSLLGNYNVDPDDEDDDTAKVLQALGYDPKEIAKGIDADRMKEIRRRMDYYLTGETSVDPTDEENAAGEKTEGDSATSASRFRTEGETEAEA